MIDLAHLGDWVLEEDRRRSEWRSAATEADDAASRAMVKRRRDFELMLGDHPEEVTDEQRMRAWELAESEPGPDRMSIDQRRACYGRARDL